MKNHQTITWIAGRSPPDLHYGYVAAPLLYLFNGTCMHIITSPISPFFFTPKNQQPSPFNPLLMAPIFTPIYFTSFACSHAANNSYKTPLIPSSLPHASTREGASHLLPSLHQMGTHPPLLFPMAAAPNPSHSSPTKWNHMINRSMLCRWFYLLGMTTTIVEIFSLLFISYISPC